MGRILGSPHRTTVHVRRDARRPWPSDAPEGPARAVWDHYHVVQLHDGIKLIPVADDPLEALREEFADVEKTAGELREGAREAALDEAGR